MAITNIHVYLHTLPLTKPHTQFDILTHTCTNCSPDLTHTYPHSRMRTCTHARTISRYECTTTPTAVQIHAHAYTTNRHTTLHSIHEMCVHTCTPSPLTNTNIFYKYREACVHTHKHTRKHEGSGRSQARTCINTDHGLSTAVCPFVMPASCHQVVASEMARCPAKIRRGQPYSWHLLCQVCPEEQLLCPPGGLAPHSGTLHGGACGLFPSECRVGGGRGRARAGGIPGCVPEFTYPLGKLFMDSRGSQSWGRGRSANSQTQLCLSRQGFPPPELQTYRATWTC